ncbi:M20 family metallopeptidase [Stomatohabitans albus]|uniref:M20 family metallopeptidase n=1 Tax=Stomatohabitans albus TaxID=3110766 RepID=UPI00300C5DCD
MDPSSPYDAWSTAQYEQLIAASETAKPITSQFRGAPDGIAQHVHHQLADLYPGLIALSHWIHAHPETAFEEHASAAALAQYLDEQGFPTTIGVGSLATALQAEHRVTGPNGEQGPVIACIAEYDALKHIGHACGHNVIAATSAGAFVLAARIASEHQIPGTYRLIGTPGEEGACGKEYLIRDGVFDDVDAAIMLHPYMADVLEQPWLGNTMGTITFTGRAAHAAAAPFAGANALDAAVATYQGIAALRQHMLPSDRIHAVFTPDGGGGAVNIVPALAKLELSVRSQEIDTMSILLHRVQAIAQGAAMMHGVDVTVQFDEDHAYLPTRLNTTLGERYAVAMADRGRRVLPRGVMPEHLAASTDQGNVSMRVPAIHPTLAIAPLGTSLHTEAFRDVAITSAGDSGVADGAYALAMVALDVAADPELLAAVKAEFEASGGRIDPPWLLK